MTYVRRHWEYLNTPLFTTYTYYKSSLMTTGEPCSRPFQVRTLLIKSSRAMAERTGEGDALHNKEKQECTHMQCAAQKAKTLWLTDKLLLTSVLLQTAVMTRSHHS